MDLHSKKINGVICQSGGLELADKKLETSQLKFKLFNNGFDGEKYESVFSFYCSDKSIHNYDDLSIDIFIDEMEICRVIKALKKHLKANRKSKYTNQL